MTPQDLIDFENEIAEEFAAGKIKAPVHLGGGNEQALIKIFSTVRPDDWVLAGWRSHYHCLLKGVSRDELKAAILAGHSVGLSFPKHRVYCSGICGGIAPIAVGLAWSRMNRVFCFLGDMSAEMGVVAEAMKFAARHWLPISWVVEDNGLSVETPTQKAWGELSGTPQVERYGYKLDRPHAGIGKWVKF